MMRRSTTGLPTVGIFLSWWIYPNVESLADAAAEIAAAVDTPSYGLVGRDGLHLTLQEIGFTDELGAADIAALERDVARVAADTLPFRASVSGIGSFADAAFFQVEPWEPFREIRRKLWDACPTLRGRGPSADVPASEGGLAPHISIAYYNDTVPSAAIAERLARFRGLTLPAFTVTAISLVGVRQPTRAYFQWEVLGESALGPTLAMAPSSSKEIYVTTIQLKANR